MTLRYFDVTLDEVMRKLVAASYVAAIVLIGLAFVTFALR
jgi:hypothetical protein